MNLTLARCALVVSVITTLTAASGCGTVRTLRDHATFSLDGKAARVKENGALSWQVGTKINAPPETIWRVLTDAQAYPSWNSTIVKIDGTIAKGQTIKLVARIAPDKTYPLNVSELTPGSRMIWEDGMPLGMFAGVRTFKLTPQADGSTAFTMAEVMSGGMLGMI